MIISIPKHLLKNSNIFKKHSTFENTVNFSDSNNNLIAIHPYYVTKSPFAIIVKLEKNEFNNFFDTITYLQIDNNFLYLDNHKYNLNAVLLSNHDLLSLSLNQKVSENKLRHILNSIDNILENTNKKTIYQDILANKITDFEISFETNDYIKSLNNLIGFGEGLTPSGDDIICGTLAGLLLANNITLFETLKDQTKTVLTLNKTSIFSYTFLNYAFLGLFIEHVYNLYLTNDIDDIISKISNMGHRSGIDYLIGIKIGIKKGGILYDL